MDTGVTGIEGYTFSNVLYERAESERNVGRPKESEMYNHQEGTRRKLN
jgi:hypothetical protein